MPPSLLHHALGPDPSVTKRDPLLPDRHCLRRLLRGAFVPAVSAISA